MRHDLMSLYPIDRRADRPAALDISSNMQGEIDLRSEFLKTIYGFGGETPKGMPILIRRLRRDSITLARIRCECSLGISREPDLDTKCPFCLGEGFKFDEEWATCYKTVSGSETSLARRIGHFIPGEILNETYKFYFPYDVNLIEGDSLVEVFLDVEGNIESPVRRKTKWLPSTIEVKRLDNGRVEYYKVSCQNSNAIYIKDNYFIENP